MIRLIDRIVSGEMWKVFGNFLPEQGTFGHENCILCCDASKYSIEASYTEDEYGVYRITGKLTAKEDIELSGLSEMFILGGGEFEVYTQYNGWQNESRGDWQKLVTSVVAECKASRTSCGAVPFMAVWNKQTARGIAFHMIPQSSWEMKTFLNTRGEKADARVEIGMNKENLRLALKAGESVALPDIIFYEFKNKLDTDCFKLHNYWHNNYTKKRCPVTYNSWLGFFDKIDYETIHRQIAVAAELGVEYFVIDAGWFGNGEHIYDKWWNCRGDWEENMTGAFAGRMKDIADEVRAAGMQFGLWFEIESAAPSANILQEHPEYYTNTWGTFTLDFTKKEARDHILERLSYNIDKYGIKYIKFDYNQHMAFDLTQRGFVDFFIGYNKTIRALKEKYPDVFIENCSSGGLRTNLANCIECDGTWPSDNESPYEQLRMFRDTVLRIPPQYFDRWIAISSISGFFPSGTPDDDGKKILSCMDGEWDSFTCVQDSFLKCFLLGGQIGLSFDLTKLSDKHIDMLKEHIAKFKSERDFWDKAVCRILCSTDDLLVFQFSDIELNKIKLVAFYYKNMQNTARIYPVLDENKTYKINGVGFPGSELAEDGIEIQTCRNYRAVLFETEV